MISLRPFRDDDYPFVYAITEATMRSYVEETFGAWVEQEQRKRSEQINAEACQIVQFDNVDVGMLVVERGESHIQLSSLYLLPTAQKKGIGTSLLRELQAEAKTKALPLRLRVFKCNPARLWYQREKFIITEVTRERWLMEYKPPDMT